MLSGVGCQFLYSFYAYLSSPFLIRPITPASPGTRRSTADGAGTGTSLIFKINRQCGLSGGGLTMLYLVALLMSEFSETLNDGVMSQIP